MSESQRLFATVALAMTVFLGFQILQANLRPPALPPEAGSPSGPSAAGPTTPSPVSPSAPAAGPAGPSTATGAAATIEAAPAPIPTVADAVLPFATERFSAEVQNRDGALTRFDLAKYSERLLPSGDRHERGPVQLVTAKDNGAARPFQARWLWKLDGAAPELDFVEKPTAASPRIVLAGEREGLATRLELVPRADAYGIDYAVRLDNRGAGARKVTGLLELALAIPASSRKAGMFTPPTNVVNGICFVEDAAERRDAAHLEKEAFVAPGNTLWAGIDRQYFVVAATLDEADAAHAQNSVGRTCEMKLVGDTVHLFFGLGEAEVAAGGSYERKVRLYLGPKRDDTFSQVDTDLKEAVDYNLWGMPLGALARPMIYLLNLLHGLTASWGLAILLLTLVVKLVLFPVTFKSILSMRKMQLLKPAIDQLKVQFKDDPQRQQMEQLKLFKEKGVSPFGGCLPMLLQMPVWFALYRALWSAVDLYEQPFLWIADLTSPEKPIAFLAIVYGGVTLLQQSLTPQSPGMDPLQQKILKYFMPAFLVFVMWAMPSGLVLYMLANGVLSVVQQLFINRMKITL